MEKVQNVRKSVMTAIDAIKLFSVRIFLINSRYRWGGPDLLFCFSESDDQGIQRGCTKIPQNVTDGDCIDGKIGEVNANICYCKGNDCNKGDVKPSPTPPPSDKLRCLKCEAQDACFNNPDVDGESTICEAPENTGCYKALVGKF